MNVQKIVHLTVDEIEPDSDGEAVATLVDREGRAAVIPLAFLPADIQINQVIFIDFRIDSETTSQLRHRVSNLQHRLFHERGDRA